MGYVSTFADQMASGRTARAASGLFANPVFSASVLIVSACATFFSVRALVNSSVFNTEPYAPVVSITEVLPVQPTNDYTTVSTTSTAAPTTTTTQPTTTTTAAPVETGSRFGKASLLRPAQYPKPHIPGLTLPEEFGDGLLDAEAVFWLINQLRQQEGLEPFERGGDKLGSAARLRAGELLISFSQTRPNGTGYATAFTEAGVEFQYTMESVGYGQYTAEHIVSDWMKSAENMRNIMDPLCRNVYIYCLVGDNNVPVWVLEGYSTPEVSAESVEENQ